jgi:hypothetical protein
VESVRALHHHFKADENERRIIMAETRRRNNLPITTVSMNSVVNTAVNLFTNANELLDYSDGYIHDYECEEDIRYRIYKLQCLDDTISRVVIFTNENGYYSAIEVEGEWIEFTILDSTREKDTIRFNTRSHQHFYADDYSLMECGDTPLSKLLLGLFTDTPHIGEMVVYDAIELAKEQGLL